MYYELSDTARKEVKLSSLHGSVRWQALLENTVLHGRQIKLLTIEWPGLKQARLGVEKFAEEA